MANAVLEDIRRIKRELAALRKIKITVGVQTEAGTNIHGESLSADDHLMMIANVHEYGCTIEVTPKMRAFLHYEGMHLKETTDHVNIPERSFIRASYEKGRAKLSDAAKEAVSNLLKGDTDAMGVAEAIGKAAVELAVFELGANGPPITAFAAERRKESTTGAPLNDTETLLNHITYRIEGGGADG